MTSADEKRLDDGDLSGLWAAFTSAMEDPHLPPGLRVALGQAASFVKHYDASRARLTQAEREIQRWADLWADAHNKNGHARAEAAEERALALAAITPEKIEAGARELFRIGNERIGERKWEDVGHYYLAESEACLRASLSSVSPPPRWEDTQDFRDATREALDEHDSALKGSAAGPTGSGT